VILANHVIDVLVPGHDLGSGLVIVLHLSAYAAPEVETEGNHRTATGGDHRHDAVANQDPIHAEGAISEESPPGIEKIFRMIGGEEERTIMIKIIQGIGTRDMKR